MLAGNQSAVRVFFFLRTIATDGNNKNNNNSQKNTGCYYSQREQERAMPMGVKGVIGYIIIII